MSNRIRTEEADGKVVGPLPPIVHMAAVSRTAAAAGAGAVPVEVAAVVVMVACADPAIAPAAVRCESFGPVVAAAAAAPGGGR